MTSSNRSRPMSRSGTLAAAVALALSMTACGGGGAPLTMEPPGDALRGRVLEAALVPGLSLPKAGVDAMTQAARLSALAGPARPSATWPCTRCATSRAIR